MQWTPLQEKTTTTKIYDLVDSVLMGLDVLGLISELKSQQPITIGGCAHQRYREYIRSFIPASYEPQLHPDLRAKKYFQEQGLEVAAINVYAAWVATFFSWVLLPIIQPINLYRLIRHRRQQQQQEKKEKLVPPSLTKISAQDSWTSR